MFKFDLCCLRRKSSHHFRVNYSEVTVLLLIATQEKPFQHCDCCPVWVACKRTKPEHKTSLKLFCTSPSLQGKRNYETKKK